MSLYDKLEGALESRRRRQILRRLPDPTASNDHSDDPARVGAATLVDFCSNDYLSLSTSHILRQRFLQKLHDAPDILGSGGSRLLVNGSAHHALESRLASFFGSQAALLFNSGFDANVGSFSCIPQEGDVVVYDEYIHASVHDGIRSSRARHPGSHFSFTHNSVESLRDLLANILQEREGLRTGKSCVILAVESLYSMDGTFAPLVRIVDLVESLFPQRNAHIVVDEAHTTGIYGDQGKGLVNFLGLESRVFARLHTFGKALAGSGAVMLTSPLVKEYLLNYARALIYTTSLSNASIIAINASFDMLEDGTAANLSHNLIHLSTHFIDLLRLHLKPFPTHLISVPEEIHPSITPTCPVLRSHQATTCLVPPIIPIMTTYPRPLSNYLREKGYNARPITWPTVPKGKDRVRVCLHAGNTREEIEGLVRAIVQWVERAAMEDKQSSERTEIVMLEAKL